jgi:2'-5' RNA ligase
MRLFVAWSIPESCHPALERAVSDLKSLALSSGTKVRWSSPNQWHITVAFLGEVAENRLTVIKESVAAASSGFLSFPIELKGFGCFPPRGNSKVVWSGVDHGSTELSEMAVQVQARLSAVGFQFEKRKFVAHLTLGRIERSGKERAWREALTPLSTTIPEMRCDNLSLYQSQLTPSGPRYTILQRFPLTMN